MLALTFIFCYSKEVMKTRVFFVFIAVLLGYFLLLPKQILVGAYYACGTSCALDANGCNAGLDCEPGSEICGLNYSLCTGANNNVCQGTPTGWDTVAPCDTAGCNNPGTTRTATWSYGACSTNCGPNTRTGTCTCGAQNDCAATCASPAGACGGTYSNSSCACVECQPCATQCGQVKSCGGTCASTDIGNYGACSASCGNGTKIDPCGNSAACCVDQAPQVQPVITPAATINVGTATICWSFADSGVGCTKAWGFKCSGQSNNFIIYDGATPTSVDSAARCATLPVSSWGNHTIKVCADNGSGQNCTAPTIIAFTQPACSTSGESQTAPPAGAPANCYKDFPTLSASHDSNSNQIQFGVDTTAGANVCMSGWLAGSPASWAACGASTGSYEWGAQAGSSNTPPFCSPSTLSTTRAIDIDKQAPTPPVGVFLSPIPDASCLGKYKMTYSWSGGSDTGCAGLADLPYESEVSEDWTDYAPVVSGWSTAQTASTSQTTTLSYGGGTQLYGRVRSRDKVDNISIWSTTAYGVETITIPTPSPFPTIYIYGNYIEDTGTTTPICSGNMTIDPSLLNINLNVSGPGVTPICTPHDTWYECTITVDNINTPCATIDHSVALDGSYGTYEPGEWREQSTCDGDPVPTIMVTMGPPPPGASPTPANIFFPYGSSSGGWFKQKNTNFYNRKTRVNTIPNAPLAFDATDDNIASPNNKYLIIGAAGSVLNGGSLSLGANAVNEGGQVSYSASNWSTSSYASSSLFSPSKFTDYAKSRKQYMTITNADLSEVTESGMYYLKDNITLSTGNIGAFKDKNVVLFADTASITITNNIDNDNGDGLVLGTGSLGLIANNIIISPSVSEVEAVIVGNNVSIGLGETKLKIKGNLISLDGTFSVSRILNDARYPSLFVVFESKTYINLLPYLSISMYDWKQVQ